MKSLITIWLSMLSILGIANASNTTNTFSNPLRDQNGSDPFLVFIEPYYYLLTTTWRDVQLTRSRTLAGFKPGIGSATSETKLIYKMANPNPAGGNDVWAPELHNLNGTWYIYFSQDRKSWVLPGASDPWDWGTRVYSDVDRTQVHQEWGIDGTVVTIPKWGEYFVWSCMTNSTSTTQGQEVEELQSLCISPLDTPTSIGQFYTLSQPLETWERVEIPVNEGPAGLYHGDRVWIAYAASFCKTPDYSIGLLAWDGVSDPLNSTSWTKSKGPVFISANGNFGTAHNGFFTSPDGTETWNIYHATPNANGSCGADRQTFAQVVNWDEDGTPEFGAPVRAGEVLSVPSGEI
ncbi:glycosyl hydrolase [Rhypophila decipiens]|uniref:Glycosyl hydrolase n=1 Tax=Rhypophila decipiens TaxID=261697 RepID=A0AAN6Y0I1_9PEZI|nr:glycosyl hydrolase [Rhypophila decipiens]